MQVWLPTQAAQAAGTAFAVQARFGGGLSLHMLTLPPAHAELASDLQRSIALPPPPAAAAETLRNTATSSQLSAGLIDGTGSQFAVVLSLPAKQEGHVYVPVDVALALIEVNSTTPTSGISVESKAVGTAVVPEQGPRQYNWTSRVVPVWPTSQTLLPGPMRLHMVLNGAANRALHRACSSLRFSQHLLPRVHGLNMSPAYHATSVAECCMIVTAPWTHAAHYWW